VSTFLWIVLAVVYFTLLVALGLTTLRKGHTFLFFAGIFLPFLWIVGAMLQPTATVVAAEPRTGLQ
jgi:ATP/ADP translocase